MCIREFSLDLDGEVKLHAVIAERLRREMFRAVLRHQFEYAADY
jgi:hypothetical protein